MRIIPGKVVEKIKTQFKCINSFENPYVYKIIWKKYGITRQAIDVNKLLRRKGGICLAYNWGQNTRTRSGLLNTYSFSMATVVKWPRLTLHYTHNPCSIHHSLVFSLEGRAWQEQEPSHVTGMALAHCILGKFLGVVCHCFPPPLDVPTSAARCLCPQRRERS